jgi:hypothetical protein
VFVCVRDRELVIRVFSGSDATALRMDNIAAVEALAVFEEPYNWEEFFALTCPL